MPSLEIGDILSSQWGGHSQTYAGIGSRSTPEDIQEAMGAFAAVLSDRGFTLRSGGAPGADTAFEVGCDRMDGRKEIFLPWKRFNHHPSHYFRPSPEAFAIASELHPQWARCNYAARSLHARKVHQILGADLQAPVGFVLFWAPEYEGIVTGGTATAVKLARVHRIPVFNLYKPSVFKLWNTLRR